MTKAEVALNHSHGEHCWQVERFDSDGSVEITKFYGNNPHDRALAFAKLLNF